MQDRYIKYLLIIAAILSCIWAVSILKGTASRPKGAPARQAVRLITAPAKTSAGTAPGYSIEEMKSETAIVPGGKVEYLEDIYKEYPKEDVGTSMKEAWTRVGPAAKAQFTQGLDKKIEECGNILKTDPYNKKARVILSMSESLKKAALADFTCSRKKK